jgi:hypothetical protein
MMMLFVLNFGCSYQNPSELHLNDIQLVGSHNSYKKAIDSELMQILYKEDSNLAMSLEYEHLPIKEQLDLGMRNLELDIFHDPQGGKYNSPLGLQVIQNASPYDSLEMNKPGMKVFHVQDIDFRSHYYLFSEALSEIKDWSDSNPQHIPVIITMNLKDEIIDRKGFQSPLPFNHSALDSVDNEILSVMGWDKLIHPDMVRSSYPTLEKAIIENGWPFLDEVKGKFLFMLDAGENINKLYVKDHPSLSGRVMFINSKEGTPEAAFMILNNPFISFATIQEFVKKGYMVRTRSDANTIEARNNDYSRWLKALESGAQVITTDYYKPSNLFESDYQVGFKADTVYKINSLRIKNDY